MVVKNLPFAYFFYELTCFDFSCLVKWHITSISKASKLLFPAPKTTETRCLTCTSNKRLISFVQPSFNRKKERQNLWYDVSIKSMLSARLCARYFLCTRWWRYCLCQLVTQGNVTRTWRTGNISKFHFSQHYSYYLPALILICLTGASSA